MIRKDTEYHARGHPAIYTIYENSAKTSNANKIRFRVSRMVYRQEFYFFCWCFVYVVGRAWKICADDMLPRAWPRARRTYIVIATAA